MTTDFSSVSVCDVCGQPALFATERLRETDPILSQSEDGKVFWWASYERVGPPSNRCLRHWEVETVESRFATNEEAAAWIRQQEAVARQGAGTT